MVPVAHVGEAALETMQPYVGAIVARSIIQVAKSQCKVSLEHVAPGELGCLVTAIESGIRAFLADPAQAEECCRKLRSSLSMQPAQGAASASLRIDINEEIDIVTARGRSRELCAEIGFPVSEQVKIATVVSELARNIVQYAGVGGIELRAITSPSKGIEVIAEDRGSGIPNVDVVLSGDYQSRTGMGVGLVGTKRLMDDFDVRTGPTGTRIVTRKYSTWS